MTFDDDFIRLNLSIASPNLSCKGLGFEWPPPERILIDEGGKLREATPDDDPALVMVRVSFSQITDEQRAQMTHVCRGAEYHYEAALS